MSKNSPTLRAVTETKRKKNKLILCSILVNICSTKDCVL